MINKSIWAVFLAIFSLSLALFFPSLSYYFFQDDWFVLNWARTGDLASFFSFRTDIIYWRPLSMPLLFAAANFLFGLKPLGFHLLAFAFYFALIIAVYKLFQILTSQRLALIASFLYATWPIHYMSLSWLSTTSYIIGPLFETLSFIFFLKFIADKRTIFLVYCFILFLLGIASSEFTLVLPFIFLAYTLIFKKKFYAKAFIAFIVVDFIYLLLRFIIFSIPARGDYQPIFNLQLFNNFIWYLAWSLGLPESFKSLIFPSLPAQSIKVISQFWAISLPVFLLFLLLARQIFVNLKTNLRLYFFGLIWFSIGLAPIITLGKHSYPMYLSFAGLGFLYLVTSTFKNAKNLILISLLILWTFISFANLQFTRVTHWIRNEQAVSRAYINYAREIVKNPPPNSVFLFKPANMSFSQKNQFVLVEGEDTLQQSLNNQNAIQVIFNDSTLKSIYATWQQKVNQKQDFQIFEIAPRL